MQNRKTALVVGGGIAGAATAYWLGRAGVDVTVLERAETLRTGGQVVDVRGRSRDVLDAAGVLPALDGVRRPERGTAIWDARGRRIAALDSSSVEGEGVVAEIEVLRDDLGRVLAEAAGDAEWLFGDVITDIQDDDHGVQIALAAGGPRRFDLVVGADGLHSQVRRHLFGPEEQHLTPLGGYMAYFTVSLPEGLDDGWFHQHVMPGGRVLMLRSAPEPGTAKAILVFRSDAVQYDRKDRGQQEEILRSVFTGGSWHTARVLADMPASPDLYFDALARVDLPGWSHGRIGLVGDAAYSGSPLTGQGTAMAIVGAYLLACAIAAHPDEHAAAFAEYESSMRPYAVAHQKLYGGGLKALAPMSRWGVGTVNTVNRLLSRRFMRPVLERMLASDDAFVLPPAPRKG